MTPEMELLIARSDLEAFIRGDISGPEQLRGIFREAIAAAYEDAARIAEQMPSCEQNATGKWLNDPGMVAAAIRKRAKE